MAKNFGGGVAKIFGGVMTNIFKSGVEETFLGVGLQKKIE